MYSLKNKKIGIFGLGITGISIYSDIARHTNEIICWDDSEKNRTNFQDVRVFHISNRIINMQSQTFQNLSDMYKKLPRRIIQHYILQIIQEQNFDGIYEGNEFDVIAIPTIIVPKPKTLVGMGDTISSISLIAAK